MPVVTGSRRTGSPAGAEPLPRAGVLFGIGHAGAESEHVLGLGDIEVVDVDVGLHGGFAQAEPDRRAERAAALEDRHKLAGDEPAVVGQIV